MEANLRHQQVILFYSGGAVILFSFWSLVKHIFNMIISPPPWEQLLAQYDIPGLEDLLLTEPDLQIDKFMRETGNIILIIFLITGMLIYTYLGISAIKDAAGKKKRFFYLIITALVFIAAIYSTVTGVRSYMEDKYVFENYAFYDERLSAMIIETFSQLCLLIIIVAGCRARWLRHKIAKAKTGE